MDGRKTLVAYFSASGQTARLASTIARVTGGKLHEIVPAVRYTSADLDWNDSASRSTVEMKDPASRPEIAGPKENIGDYDVVFLGFPIWWGVAPHIVETFLESHDFAGRTIVPFATSGGSSMGNTDAVLHASCPKNVDWRMGKLLSSHASADSVGDWVDSLKL